MNEKDTLNKKDRLIPRKPKNIFTYFAYIHTLDTKCDMLCCPVCNNPLTSTWNKLEHIPRFCYNCGQAIDWSKENE